MRYIKAFLREDQAYFANCKRSITAQNSHMLVDGCVLYSLVLAFYTVLSIVTHQPAVIRNMYVAFDGVHALLCVAVFTRPNRIKNSYRATQIFCALLEFSILCFFALEGGVASRTQHSLYVPIAILLVQLLFIHRALYSTLVIFLYTGSFAVLSCLNKTPEAYTNDVYIALATFLSANIGYMLIAKLRRSEQKALIKLETLSKLDGLTGLNNKTSLEQLYQTEILQNGRTCTLIVMDIDDFKQVNDAYGHDVGDEVLRGVGDVIKHVFRANDILARFGGDEFVIILDSCDDPAVVRDRMGVLRRQVNGLSFSAPGLKARCSAGAAFTRDSDDFHTLFARADQALYRAKREGKDRLCLEDGAPRLDEPGPVEA